MEKLIELNKQLQELGGQRGIRQSVLRSYIAQGKSRSSYATQLRQEISELNTQIQAILIEIRQCEEKYRNQITV